MSELAGRLMNMSLLGAWEDEGVVHLYWDHADWHESMLEALGETLLELGLKVDHDEIRVQTIPWQDWNRIWTESVQPIHIGKRIVVRPSWSEVEVAEDGIELILDPKQAFGTGHHATTQLLCEWLEDTIQGGEQVLDVGTGSGLLGMVALRLGATSVLAIDHDAVALECAKEYARMNHFGPELEFQVLDIHDLSDGQYDVILANIDRRTLLSVDQAFANVAGSHTLLLMTGILESDYEELVAYYRQYGWRDGDVRKRAEWIAIELVRRAPDYLSG
ncbi:MAG: 50S ribosomal protein L11 methyltransferase [Nitrospirales bacterium]|nr:50S ribosomal protein L11 methyltransferase [Nitrospira sp.]MDR4502449.1 50S ribosomal protein L11 methyltransferase [Nitrospirales bacterium]